MADIPAEEWTKEVEEVRAALRRRFPDLHCLRCRTDNFRFRLWPDESLVPGLASETDNRVVELICENDDHLLRTIDESVRTIPGVRSAEAFVYLQVAKETYQWGTR